MGQGTYDSDRFFQCGNYRNMYAQCTLHYIKATAVEGAIQQAVAQYALSDSDTFVDEIMGHWESQSTDTTAEDRKGIATAQKRMSELDSLIKGLYEAGITGSLPEAAKKYEEGLERKREYNRGYSRRKREEDPDYHRNRGRKQYKKLMEKRAELKEMAKTDENARKELEAIREREAEKSKEQRERKIQRASEDAEYAKHVRERTAEYNRRHTAKRSAQLQELKERAKTDKKAARELAELRAKGAEAARKSRLKKMAEKAQAENEAVS